MFSIKPPTLRGEIKKARASNYTWDRAVCEFIDNSNDILIKSEQDEKTIKIKLNKDTNDNLYSISISDNFNVGIQNHNIWEWTFERDRDENDCGDFGTGFKSGSVNISSELLVVTSNNVNFTKMRAEWDEMAEHNTYTPTFETIDKTTYNKYHPFEFGSTFLLKQLIKTNIPNDINHMRNELINRIKVVYKKLLKQHKDISIIVDDKIINHSNITDEINIKKIHKEEKIPKSAIYVYRNNDQYIPIVKYNNSYYKVQFKDDNQKRKPNGNLNIADMRGYCNGAELVDLSKYNNNKDEYTLVDTLVMKSRCIYHLCKKWLMNETERPDPNGYINLIRKNRTLSDKCTAMHCRGDSYGTYMYHELTYKDRRMDNPLGVQFNKNTDNKIQSEELEASILWCQKVHEKEIKKNEGESGHGHIEKIKIIKYNYNKFKNKFNINNLRNIFDNWIENVNWEEYEKKKKEKEEIIKKKVEEEEEEEEDEPEDEEEEDEPEDEPEEVEEEPEEEEEEKEVEEEEEEEPEDEEEEEPEDEEEDKDELKSGIRNLFKDIYINHADLFIDMLNEVLSNEDKKRIKLYL
jgi:hypothetical protein